MKTEILKVDPSNIDIEIMKSAAAVILSGGLVAFPTETVYGLGANAFDKNAVEKIFVAKGRPQDNPLIVHVASEEQAESTAEELTPEVRRLTKAFWPGPLTLVMKKSSLIPDNITAGLDTVAVRMPSHPAALELIRLSGVPIAAPSANLSGRPSTTSAQHVIEDLAGKIDMILDAGSTRYGIESTVLDTTTAPMTVLRPGGLTVEALKGVLGNIKHENGLPNEKAAPRSPGMKYRHYSPKAEMYIVVGDLEQIVTKILQVEAEYRKRGIHVGILATDQTSDRYSGCLAISSGDRRRPDTIASNFFGVLRKFDKMDVSVILAEAVDTNGLGLAIMNRMEKAAGYNIIMA